MRRQGYKTAFSICVALGLGGCAVPVGAYHDIEGGAISQTRQAPPGMDQPYPNLADVPAAPAASAPGAQAAITAQAQTAVSAPSAGALAGLSLPAAAPPLPDVPGLTLPASPAAMAPAPAVPAAPPPLPPSAAIGAAIGFAPGSALLPPAEAARIAALAAQRGGAKILAGGFGEGALPLALARARRVADALQAAGVPPQSIRLSASAAGSGGFVQFVY